MTNTGQKSKLDLAQTLIVWHIIINLALKTLIKTINIPSNSMLPL